MKFWILFYIVLFTVELYDASPLTKKRSKDYDDALDIEGIMNAIMLQTLRNDHPIIGPQIKTSDSLAVSMSKFTEKKKLNSVTVTNPPTLGISNIRMSNSKPNAQSGKAGDNHIFALSTSTGKKEHIPATVTSHQSLMMSHNEIGASKEKEQFGKSSNSPVVETSLPTEKEQVLVTATNHPNLLSSNNKMDISKENVEFRKASDSHTDILSTSTENKEHIVATDPSHSRLVISKSKPGVTETNMQFGKASGSPLVAPLTFTEEKAHSKIDNLKENVQFGKVNNNPIVATPASTENKIQIPDKTMSHTSLLSSKGIIDTSNEITELTFEEKTKKMIGLQDPHHQQQKAVLDNNDKFKDILVLIPKEKSHTTNSKRKEIENGGHKDVEMTVKVPEKSTQQQSHENKNILRNANADIENQGKSLTVSKNYTEPLIKHLNGEKGTDKFEEKSKNVQHVNLGTKDVTASTKESNLMSDILKVTPKKANQFENDKAVTESALKTHVTKEVENAQKFANHISYQKSLKNDKINSPMNNKSFTAATKIKGKQEKMLVGGQTEKTEKQN